MHRKLARELIDIIQDLTINALICPGVIYPRASQPPSHLARNGHVSMGTKRSSILCLSKSIYANYRPCMFSENTFVIGTGPKTTRFLNELPHETRNLIQKVYLNTSIRDHDKEFLADLSFGMIALDVNDRADGAEMVSMLCGSVDAPKADRIDFTNPKVTRGEYSHLAGLHLCYTWWYKIDHVCALPSLKEWVLDLSESYGPDGEWIAPELMKQTANTSMPYSKAVFSTVRPHPEKKGETIVMQFDPETGSPSMVGPGPIC
ncbi:MAG: hypothetical protein Q9221_001227 [Calogaya cf. arnoldii]